MHLPCLIIAFYGRIYTRLWRVGYRQVVLGCRKHFGCPKTQLAMFLCSYVRLNINFQCLEITIQQSKFYSNISIGALVITLAGYLFITNKQIKQ